MKALTKDIKTFKKHTYFMLNQLLHSDSLERIISNNASKTSQDRKKAAIYSPISLTNCIGKLCKTDAKNVILGHCEATKGFGLQQCIQRATDNLIVLTQHVSEAYQWSEMAGLVCLDKEKDFDAIWRIGLIDKCDKLGVQKIIIILSSQKETLT